LILRLLYGRIFIIIGGEIDMPSYWRWIYILAGIALLGISFFFMMRSANKNLEALQSKSKKKRRK